MAVHDRFVARSSNFRFWPATAEDVIRIAANQSSGGFLTGHRALGDPEQSDGRYESGHSTRR